MARKIEVDLKLIIIFVAFLILATVGSAFATYLIFRDNTGPQSVTAEKDTVAKEIGPTFAVGEFILNLDTSGNRQQFIRAEVVLEADGKRAISELERRKPQIRDHFISLIRSRSAEQLSNEAGMELLRFEMMQDVNGLISKGEVTNVFFIDLIIQ